jgi:hypothetical protein
VSTENPVIPNFDGLEGFEELASRLRLNVRVALAADPEQLEPGSTIRLPSFDFRKIGVELVHDWTDGEVAGAAAQAKLTDAQIDVVVIAEDGFLKERTIVAGPESAADFPCHSALAPYNGERVAAMQNSERGFALVAHLVLGAEREPKPFQPHRKGTILASARFQVRATRDTGGLDPKPLTDEKISEFKLTKNSVLYVHCDDDMVTLEHLEGQLEVYVNEALLAAASHQRTDERDAVMNGLAIEAMGQLIHHVSRELETITPPEGDGSAVLRMIRRSLADAGVKKSADEVVELVRDDPFRVVGLLSGLDHRAQRLLSVVAGREEQDEEDPSS